MGDSNRIVLPGTGYASHDAALEKDAPVHEVPLVIANEQNLEPYGRIVKDFENEDIWLEQWPQTGKRPICSGTGIQKSLITERFTVEWKGTEAVNGPRLCGLRDGNFIVVREINYHPDSGQAFWPENGSPFIANLALPTDDPKPEDFVAFYFDGSCGLQIRPSVWHQAMFPSYRGEGSKGTFLSKQGHMKTIIVGDTLEECGKWLKVPLSPES